MSGLPPDTAAFTLAAAITNVQTLKAAMASADEVRAAVALYVALRDGKPLPPTAASTSTVPANNPQAEVSRVVGSESPLDAAARRIRELKASCASQDEVKAAVAHYVALRDGIQESASKSQALQAALDTVNMLKASMACREEVKAAVEMYVALREGNPVPPLSIAAANVRSLKAANAPREEVAAAVRHYLALRDGTPTEPEAASPAELKQPEASSAQLTQVEPVGDRKEAASSAQLTQVEPAGDRKEAAQVTQVEAVGDHKAAASPAQVAPVEDRKEADLQTEVKSTELDLMMLEFDVRRRRATSAASVDSIKMPPKPTGEHYEVRYETRPGAFGLSICDKTSKPYICLVPQTLAAARKGVRVGSILTHVNGVPLEGLHRKEWRPLLASSIAPVVLSFVYDPEQTMRDIQNSDCCYWPDWIATQENQADTPPAKMVVLPDKLLVRMAPGDQSHVVGELHCGDVVYATATQGAFVRVTHNGQAMGWVFLREGIKHCLQPVVVENEDLLPELLARPSFMRMMSVESQNMQGDIEGLYLWRAPSTQIDTLWGQIQSEVIQAISLWSERPVEKGISDIILAYARVRAVGEDVWDFPLCSVDTGAQVRFSEILANGKPTVMFFCHQDTMPMGMLAMVLRFVGGSPKDWRPHPGVNFLIVIMQGGVDLHSEKPLYPDGARIAPAIDPVTTHTADAIFATAKVPKSMMYVGHFSQFAVVDPKPCGCTNHTTRLFIINKNRMVSFNGADSAQFNERWPQALDIVFSSLDKP